MLSLFKVLHVIGVAMFLGSILAHISAGQLIPGATTDPAAMAFARQAIDVATRYVTLPGLTLAVISGVLLAAKGYPGFLRRRWLAAHQIAALIIVTITVLVMIPTGHHLLTVATALVAGQGSQDAFTALEAHEASFGTANIIVLFAAIVLGVVKPGLGQKQP